MLIGGDEAQSAGRPLRERESWFTAELGGLALVRRRAGVRTPTPIADDLAELEHGCLLLFEALPEQPPRARTREDWRALGRTLAAPVPGSRGSLRTRWARRLLGPLRQDNRRSASDRWADFYAARRILPRLRSAVDPDTSRADSPPMSKPNCRALAHAQRPEPQPSAAARRRPAEQLRQHRLGRGGHRRGAPLLGASPGFTWPLSTTSEPVPAEVFEAYGDSLPIDLGSYPPRAGASSATWPSSRSTATGPSGATTPLARLAEAVRTYLSGPAGAGPGRHGGRAAFPPARVDGPGRPRCSSSAPPSRTARDRSACR